jgi:hypothetical protein
MKSKNSRTIVIVIASLSVLVSMVLEAQQKAAQDRYTLKALNGVSFSEFKGYDEWQDVAVSRTDTTVKAMLGNPAMIKAYKSGIPGNGQPFPDGVKIVKICGPKNELSVSLCGRDTGQPGSARFHREGFQEIPRHEWMGIRAI